MSDSARLKPYPSGFVDSAITVLITSANRVRSRSLPILLVCASACFFFTCAAKAQIRSVETPIATLRLSEHSGDLVGLTWKNPNLELIGEPRLGENFRLLVPKPSYESDYFNSRDQQVNQIQVVPD